jgi:hypothetical protein
MPFLCARQWLKLLPAPMTVLLDLDSCTMYGNDFNDLIWMMQLMKRPRDSILTAMRALLNPAMARAIRRLEAAGHRVRVCVYTRKGCMVEHLPRFAAPNGDLYFPATTRLGGAVSRSACMYNAFERLFLARQVIGEALGRTDIEMVVTRNTKSVAATCAGTLKPPADPSHAVLYDDNREYHHSDVILVPPYDAIQAADARVILDLMGGDPMSDAVVRMISDGLDECYSSLDASNRIKVNTTSDPAPEWPLPVASSSTVSLQQHLAAAARGYTAAFID